MSEDRPTPLSPDTAMLLGRIDANVQTLLAKVSANEVRITALEKWRWLAVGALVILFGVVVQHGHYSWLMSPFQ